MRFDPKSEEDLKRESLLDAGTYDFEVTKSEDAISKTSGKEMIAITLRIFSDRGERTIRDWLMPSMGFKFRHFAETTGLLTKYSSGELTANDCLGRSGKVTLVIKDSEQYGPQNNVKDYVKPQEAKESPEVPVVPAAIRKPAASTDDQIPF